MSIFGQLSFFSAWSPCGPAYSFVVCHIHVRFDVLSLFLKVRELVFAILDVIPMSHWNWKFTQFTLVLFLKAILTVVLRKSKMPYTVAVKDLTEVRERPRTTVPLLGTRTFGNEMDEYVEAVIPAL